MMVGGEDERRSSWGFSEDADLDAFHRHAHDADRPTAGVRHRTVRADLPRHPHQLFLIPAGTPHGSGEGNVVLEVSATPYLYSLRFYDWLRRDAAGKQRPVHVEHAFRNLDTERTGARGRPRPRAGRRACCARATAGARRCSGALPEMFFEVRRLALSAGPRRRTPTPRPLPRPQRRRGRRDPGRYRSR